MAEQIAEYGTWKSPITTDILISDVVKLGQTVLDGEDVYWIEGRPKEGGRNALVRRTPDGNIQDVVPQSFNVRTRVHEYGGGDFTVSRGVIYFSNFVDQRLYRMRPGETPEPITPEGAFRYADGQVDEQRSRLVYVREDHTKSDQEAENTLVSVPVDGQGEIKVLAHDYDFYSDPRLSPDGSQLCWLSWRHPNMPWDGTELWLADLNEQGSLQNSRKVAGGEQESIFQPEWSPAGELYFVSDRTGWWNLYHLKGDTHEALHQQEAEFGQPQWVFGRKTYSFASEQQIICIYSEHGIDYLASLDCTSGQLSQIQTGYSAIRGIVTGNGSAYFLGASFSQPSELVKLDFQSMKSRIIKKASSLEIDPGYISIPQSVIKDQNKDQKFEKQPAQIEFPTEGGQTAYGFFYPPKNKDYHAPEGILPPLLVQSHGGPTGSAPNSLNMGYQYWTSRGFAVLDVDYGGSTGYGRAYRERLKGNWGIVDMNDCVNGAKYLVDQGYVNPDWLAISGGSAGGYTTLCALTFKDLFKAGASYFGIGNLIALVGDTHKFESRYNDSLIGPYPEKAEEYRRRSPINYTDQLSCPVLFLQGSEDPVVPPNQSQTMVAALKKKGLPVAYLEFEGESHGFRKSENIKRSLEAEYYFYAQVFGFKPADRLEPVQIDNQS